jgi:hypothetical protein
MHVETRRSRGLIALGGALFGLPYLGGVVGLGCCGNNANGLGWLVVPIGGPFVASGLVQTDGERAALIVDGVVQAAGLAVLLVAVFTPHQVLVDDPYVATGTPGFAWRIAPGSPGALGGLTFDARF